MPAPSANIDLVKQLYAAMREGNADAVLPFLTHDVEFVVPGPAELGAAGTWRGAEGIRECLRRLHQGQENLSIVFEDFVADEQHVVVRLSVKARVLATNRVFESQIIHFFVFEGARISKLLDFFDTEALARAYATNAG